MKKKLIFFLCTAFMLALGLATFSSCGDSTPKAWSKEEIETLSTESASTVYYDLVNPTFSSVNDVVDYRDNTFEGKSIDSTFEALPEVILRRVADVCINKHGSTDKKDIVREYIKNQSVYINMSDKIPSAESKDDKSTATDSGGSDVTKDDKSKVFETSYNYYTDTVDGKPVKVQVKTEKSYEK